MNGPAASAPVNEKDRVDELRARFHELLTQDESLAGLFPGQEYLKSAKFSRAKLLFEVASLNDISLETAFEAALGVELVHMATLVHDDVIDAADTRRNQASLRSVSGDKTAILFGDYLFALAVEQIQNTQSPGGTRRFIESVKFTCRGETIQDLYLTQNTEKLKVDQLLDVAKGKTGALFSYCMEGPFWMDEKYDDEIRKIVGEIGLSCGLAYQLADDVLDIMGDGKNLGKPQGNDLSKGCMTTPLFLLMKELNLSWDDFQKQYSPDSAKLSSVFADSGAFNEMKKILLDLKTQLDKSTFEMESRGVCIRNVSELFWDRLINKRIKDFKDQAL